MIQTSTVSPEPTARLEISDRRLPARMRAARIRADLPRRLPIAVIPPRGRARLAVMLLLVIAVPLFGVSRRRHAT